MVEFIADVSILMEAEPTRAIASWLIPAIAGGVSAATNLFSSWKAGKDSANANNEAEAQVREQKAENEEWYNRKMNENYLETAEAQAALSKAEGMARDQLAAAKGANAVMGGTDANLDSTRKAANDMLSQTVSGIATTAQARKDSAEQTYLTRNNELTQQLINMYGQKAANSASAGSSALGALGNTAASIITAFGGSSNA